MGFLDNLKKNNFKSISERAISNLQNKDNQNTEKKVEKVSTTETSGITKQSDLSKAGLANTAMGQNESNTHKKNYFNDTFINPNKKILGENVDTLFKNAKSNTKEILESIILQEGLTDLIRNNAGKIATAGVLGAGVAAGHALGGGDFDFNKDDQSTDQAQSNKATTVSNSGDALKQAKDMRYNESIKNETVNYNEKQGLGKTLSNWMDRNATARNNQDYYDTLEKAQELRDNKNPDWFTTGEKLGAGAIGAGLVGGGLLAARAKSGHSYGGLGQKPAPQPTRAPRTPRGTK